jgi:biotin-dependent carboxylase-like uncharacterized protein
MKAAIRVLYAGPGVTLHDGGRHGYLRFGISTAGPMDRLAFRTANLAAGAEQDATAIEVSIGGVDLSAEGGAVGIAVAGGGFQITLDGCGLPGRVAVRLEPGARLNIRAGASGCWCYAGVSGSIGVAAVLGSTSTHLRSGIGGLDGRMLRAGDCLPVTDAFDLPAGAGEIVAPWLDRPGDVIRVIPGPQDDYFAADQIAAFFQEEWTVSTRSDRMAYLLDGRPLRHAQGFNIVSDGVAMGAIQVPGDGRPLVFMADRPPTGGYPKIANVIGADVGKLAQLRPGARFRFAAATNEEAVRALRAGVEALHPAAEVRRLPPLRPASPTLLAVNLIGGVTDGLAE